MRPLLFQIPLPALRLSLWPALLGAAIVVALLAFLTFRQAPAGERRGLVFPGAVVASLLVAAFFYRDRALVVEPIDVGGFGAMLALALGLGVWLTQRAAERRGLSRIESGGVCAAVAVSGIVGARVCYALLHPGDFGSILGVVAFFDGGLVVYGALAFGVVAAFVASRRRGLSPFAWLDAASASLAIGVVLTRFGCWLEGCDFGRVLSAGAPRFLARLGTFPAGSPAWTHQVSTQTIAARAPVALPVHPTQLYEAVGGALLVALVLGLQKRTPRAGVSAFAVLAGYVSLRVLVDFGRPPSREVWLGRFVLFAGIIGVALVGWKGRWRARSKA
jgi:phosphatidylglycerol:prolipoprotein diacylglycerol transferase